MEFFEVEKEAKAIAESTLIDVLRYGDLDDLHAEMVDAIFQAVDGHSMVIYTDQAWQVARYFDRVGCDECYLEGQEGLSSIITAAAFYVLYDLAVQSLPDLDSIAEFIELCEEWRNACEDLEFTDRDSPEYAELLAIKDDAAQAIGDYDIDPTIRGVLVERFDR